MSKFKIGDKVKAVQASQGWGRVKRGDIGVITRVNTDGSVYRVDFSNRKDWYATDSDLELVEPKPTKNQRITALEKTVAEQGEEINELKLIVAQIRKPSTEAAEALTTTSPVEDIIEFEGKQYKRVDRKAREGDVVIITDGAQETEEIKRNKPYKVDGHGQIEAVTKPFRYKVYRSRHNRTPETVDVYELVAEEKQKTANQLRAEMIEKAKAFVKKYQAVRAGEGSHFKGNRTCRQHYYETEFIVKGNKVTALLRWSSLGVRVLKDERYVRYVGRAYCSPADVFNEHIGKAIALGRALGLDVSEFEQVVQPTNFVKGQLVKYANSELLEVDHVSENEVSEKSVYFACGTWMHDYELTIINDTNAQY